jgi:hypothetical protein
MPATLERRGLCAKAGTGSLLEHFSNESLIGVHLVSDADHQHNPKQDEHPGSNAEKDPHDWVTGDEKMTGAQASYLKTLSEEAKDPDAFRDDLTKAEASIKIDELKQRVGR